MKRPTNMPLFKRLAPWAATFRLEAWVSKLPGFSIATLAYATMHQEQIPAAVMLTAFLLTTTHLASGYVVNDLADWDADKAAGDKRALHDLGRRKGWAILTILTATHLAICIAMLEAPYQWVVVWITFLAHVAYSYGPRLKGKGLIGVLSSSINQWVTPFLILVTLHGQPEVHTAALVALWLFSVGVNGAIRHQINDAERDRISRTNTFVQNVGRNRSVGHRQTASIVAILVPVLAPFIATNHQAGAAAALTMVGFAVYHTNYYKRIASHRATTLA